MLQKRFTSILFTSNRKWHFNFDISMKWAFNKQTTKPIYLEKKKRKKIQTFPKGQKKHTRRSTPSSVKCQGESALITTKETWTVSPSNLTSWDKHSSLSITNLTPSASFKLHNNKPMANHAIWKLLFKPFSAIFMTNQIKKNDQLPPPPIPTLKWVFLELEEAQNSKQFREFWVSIGTFIFVSLLIGWAFFLHLNDVVKLTIV